MELKEIEVENLITDDQAQPRAILDEYTVNEYRLDMLDGDKFPPLMVFGNNGSYYVADGFHRLAAAKQIGIERIECAVKPGELRDAILYSCQVNADHGKRRNNGDKRRAVKKLLNDAEWSQWSDREIARQCKVSKTFVNKLRPKETVTGNVASERKYKTKHGTTAVMDTSNIGKSQEQKPEEQSQTSWNIEPPDEQKPKYDPANYRLFVSPVDELSEHIEPNSIDAIITDPPYPKEYIYTFGHLAESASLILKDGGVLVALCGQYYLPQYLELITEHLNYHWLGMYYMPGGPHYFDRNKLITNRCKPLIIATKGKWTKKHFIDTVINDQQDKRFHEWGQGISGFFSLVEQFTKPNDTVLDPFIGGGTTAIATLDAGRYFIGSDISEEEINKTLARLNHVE